MKIYPESQLPLKPKKLAQRYLIYSFESRARCFAPQIILFLAFLLLWAVSQYWFVGVLAAFNLFGVYLSFEARTIIRMIQRDSVGHKCITQQSA